MSDSVRVAVRVRPFNSRENARKASVIISMSGNTTSIKDPDNPKAEPKKFAFDHSYWSHDGFKEDNKGYLQPSNSKYADQKNVFDDLGRGVLENAWKGYNCSLFAYGQTGSGKSYSMVGYGANKGIVPITCEELFKEIEVKKGSASSGEEYQVTFSMLEIYNEQVRDLLNPASLKVKGGLKVRQHPKQGFYVETLKQVPVHSYAEIDQKTEQGTKNRTVASTNMNATSSRAHTIVAINFTQKTLNAAKQSMTKTSCINLVDLAGSERAASTGATGDRLKEGASINKSLSTLGNCIKALADISQGNKKVIVPFRDSCLTKLLMNALGGNSKTVMIAALSPADINYDETLSTLRFADRAKAVKTQAVINESPTDKLIRELREENERLKKMLDGGGAPLALAEDGGGGGGGKYTDEEVAEMKRSMEEMLKSNQSDLEDIQKTWEEKLSETQKEYQASLDAQKKQKQEELSTPHFYNLNEDPSLTRKVVHLCQSGKKTIGSNKASKAPDIVLVGLGIQDEQGIVQNDKNKKVALTPTKGATVLLNGNAISSKKDLHHNDRVLFGNTNLFVFFHPTELADLEKKKKPIKTIDYGIAQEEIAKNSGLSMFTCDGKSKEDLILQEDLIHILPMVSECNAMSEELDKKVKFEIALISPQARGKKHGRTEVYVKVKNLDTKNDFLWDRDTFINRKYLMQEMYQNFVAGEDVSKIPQDQDPFWDDPTSEQLIGCVHVYLESLAYMIELKETLAITDYRGADQGQLMVEVLPCRKDGKDIGDDFVDDPSELIGKPFYFKIKIESARGIAKKFEKSFCRYRFYLDQEPIMCDARSGMNPNFGHEHMFDIPAATQKFVEYLQAEPLVIEVYGKQQDDGTPSNLNTQELMQKERTMVTGGPNALLKGSAEAKLKIEAVTHKRRAQRMEQQLRRIRQVVDAAKKTQKTTLTVAEVENAMKTRRLKAVAHVIMHAERAKKDEMGNNMSTACVIQ